MFPSLSFAKPFNNDEIIIIRTVINAPWFIYAADLGGDGDLDVLSASGREIAWYENGDGLGSFGAQHFIHQQRTRSPKECHWHKCLKPGIRKDKRKEG